MTLRPAEEGQTIPNLKRTHPGEIVLVGGRRAGQLLLLVRELYAVEDRTKELAEPHRLALRQAQSVPVLAKVETWLQRGPLGQAIIYARNQWMALCR